MYHREIPAQLISSKRDKFENGSRFCGANAIRKSNQYYARIFPIARIQEPSKVRIIGEKYALFVGCDPNDLFILRHLVQIR